VAEGKSHVRTSRTRELEDFARCTIAKNREVRKLRKSGKRHGTTLLLASSIYELLNPGIFHRE